MILHYKEHKLTVCATKEARLWLVDRILGYLLLVFYNSMSLFNAENLV